MIVNFVCKIDSLAGRAVDTFRVEWLQQYDHDYFRQPDLKTYLLVEILLFLIILVVVVENSRQIEYTVKPLIRYES